MSESIETLGERETRLEKIAVARCLCRNGRYPNESAVAKERASMGFSGKSFGDPTAAAAGQYLRKLGLDVPANSSKPV